MLCQGQSIRAITPIRGASKNTVAKLPADVGQVCMEDHDRHVRNLESRRVQVDEIWSSRWLDLAP
jgi:hypothetical protein